MLYLRIDIWILSFLSRSLSISSLRCQSSWFLSTHLRWIGSIQPTCRLITSCDYLSLVTKLLLLLFLSQLSWCQVKVVNDVCDICNSTIALSSTNIVDLLWITWLIVIMLHLSSMNPLHTLFLLLLLLQLLISQIKFLLLNLFAVELLCSILVLSPWVDQWFLNIDW
jgi:hypothetical protein